MYLSIPKKKMQTVTFFFFTFFTIADIFTIIASVLLIMAIWAQRKEMPPKKNTKRVNFYGYFRKHLQFVVFAN